MASRRVMPRRKDARKFRNSAVRSKKINIAPSIRRGGIRL